MSEQRYNAFEGEQVLIPEFDPQMFAANIRATYTKSIIERLPVDLCESVQQEAKALGIENDAYVALRAIEIMAKEYSEHKRNHSGSVEVYTDGACEGNPGPGGWGAIVIYQDGTEQIFCGGNPETTNNRMELMAPITALENIGESSVVTVYSDAKYVVDGVEKGWARSWRNKGWVRSNGQPALNPDLWQRLLEAIDRHTKVTFQWIKGHAGNPYNERCDKLAVKAAAHARPEP